MWTLCIFETMRLPAADTRAACCGRAKLEALAAGVEEMQTATEDRAQTEALLRAAAALEANEVRKQPY